MVSVSQFVNVNFSFLNQILLLLISSCYPWLSSQGWVYPVPEPKIPQHFLVYSRELHESSGMAIRMLTTTPGSHVNIIYSSFSLLSYLLLPFFRTYRLPPRIYESMQGPDVCRGSDIIKPHTLDRLQHKVGCARFWGQQNAGVLLAVLAVQRLVLWLTMQEVSSSNLGVGRVILWWTPHLPPSNS